MRTFSISELSRYSGVKAHTIRIWEQRYNALQPDRSEGNTRFYTDAQLRRLLNIVSLMDRGYKISELGILPDKELFRKVEDYMQQRIIPENNTEYFISQMIAAGMATDEAHFEKLFSSCIVRYGLKDTYIHIIHPLLTRIGLMWTADSMPPSNEHFISNLIRQKLFTAIDSLPPPKITSDTWLLFLKEDEFHELGLLLANYLIRQSSRPVIYLGSNVPYPSLLECMRNIRPKHLLFFIVRNDGASEFQDYINTLAKAFAGKKIYMAGGETLVGQVSIPKKIVWLNSVDQLTVLLNIADSKTEK